MRLGIVRTQDSGVSGRSRSYHMRGCRRLISSHRACDEVMGGKSMLQRLLLSRLGAGSGWFEL